MYEIITIKLKGYRACIMHTNLENTAITYKSGEVLKQLSDEAVQVMFEEASQIKAADLPIPFIRQNSKRLEDGDAFYIEGGSIFRTKTAIKNN